MRIYLHGRTTSLIVAQVLVIVLLTELHYARASKTRATTRRTRVAATTRRTVFTTARPVTRPTVTRSGYGVKTTERPRVTSRPEHGHYPPVASTTSRGITQWSPQPWRPDTDTGVHFTQATPLGNTPAQRAGETQQLPYGWHAGSTPRSLTHTQSVPYGWHAGSTPRSLTHTQSVPYGWHAGQDNTPHFTPPTPPGFQPSLNGGSAQDPWRPGQNNNPYITPPTPPGYQPLQGGVWAPGQNNNAYYPPPTPPGYQPSQSGVWAPGQNNNAYYTPPTPPGYQPSQGGVWAPGQNNNPYLMPQNPPGFPPSQSGGWGPESPQVWRPGYNSNTNTHIYTGPRLGDLSDTSRGRPSVNFHGSVGRERRYCTVRMNGDLPRPSPVILDSSSATVDTILAFKSPSPEGVLSFKRGEKVRLTCTGENNYFRELGSQHTDINVYCDDHGRFNYRGKLHAFNYYSCVEDAKRIKKTTFNLSFCNGTDEELLEVGFKISETSSIMTMTTCFNRLKWETKWTSHIIVPEIQGKETGFRERTNSSRPDNSTQTPQDDGLNLRNVTGETTVRPNVTLSEPNVTLTETNVTLTETNVTLTEPNVTLTEPNISLTEPNVSLTEENVTLTESNFALTEPDVSLTEPNVTPTESNVALSEPNDTLTDTLALAGNSTAQINVTQTGFETFQSSDQRNITQTGIEVLPGNPSAQPYVTVTNTQVLPGNPTAQTNVTLTDTKVLAGNFTGQSNATLTGIEILDGESTVQPDVMVTGTLVLAGESNTESNVTLRNVTLNDTESMVLAQLVPASDFLYGVQQASTFHFANVAPQWRLLHQNTWSRVGRDARRLASRLRTYLVVYAGTHGSATLPDSQGVEQPLYLFTNSTSTERLRAVPAVFWKIVHDPVTARGAALVGINMMHLPWDQVIATPGVDLCPGKHRNSTTWDICGASTPDFQRKGFGYCCEVDDLIGVINYIPTFLIHRFLE